MAADSTSSNRVRCQDAEPFIQQLIKDSDRFASEIGQKDLLVTQNGLKKAGVRVSQINNRRYLGNKHGLTGFIRSIVDHHCPEVNSVIDIFSGTGAVAHAFIDKTVITNDILYSNYLVNLCWFSPQDYRPNRIINAITYLNAIHTSENNYVRNNFADTYFSADDCSKIGLARELVEVALKADYLNAREYAILVTSILYGMDRIANTVGHYDAYRRGAPFNKPLIFPIILPPISLSKNNMCLNGDANLVISDLKADLLYCDPPYNSRQYSDAYHLLENIAKWEKPKVHGVARKMDRSSIKSEYNTVRAAEALRDLISKADVKYIVLSYNNMASKGNGRSNAKISDTEIMTILSEKGDVQVFEQPHRAFSTGKSDIQNNVERLFICKVRSASRPAKGAVLSPINYIGGKGRLIPQLRPLLPHTELFVDLFSGGCTVGANAEAKQVIFRDTNKQLMELMEYLATTEAYQVIHAVERIISDFGLTDTYRNTYKYYAADSSSGLASANREAFSRLRDAYNSCDEGSRRLLMLYVLIVFGFNNQLRFNKQGHFNLPVGKRDFNAKMRSKLTTFYERMNEIRFSFQVGDFRDFDIEKTPENTIFYCDPPYLITHASYNEANGWTSQDEIDLLTFLDKVNSSGRLFALSNVLEAKGAVNRLLQDWLDASTYSCHHLNMSYQNSNYQRSARHSETVEVLITNY